MREVQTRARPQQRSAGIDAVRLLGILAVVVAHAVTIEPVRTGAYVWHVPIFFFLTGYLWKSGRSLRDEAASRWRTLGVPYIAWLLIITAITLPPLVIDDGVGAGVRRVAAVVLGGSYLKSPYHAFWFVSCLFFACLAMRALERWRWGVAPLVVALLAVSVVAEPLSKVPLAAGVAIPAVIFLIAGRAARQAPAAVRHPLVAILALAAAGTVTAIGWNEPLDLKNGDFGVPVLGVAVAVAICGALTYLGERLIGSSRAVVAVASIGLVVVLTHGVPIYYLWGDVDPWLLAGIALATGLAFGWLARSLPGSRFLLGR